MGGDAAIRPELGVTKTHHGLAAGGAADALVNHPGRYSESKASSSGSTNERGPSRRTHHW